ncbi:hypothetical protein LUZ60_005627 [Juncus effusus]|nr:hypothetical protein LUZ60_005627 [Juncus effusus]
MGFISFTSIIDFLANRQFLSAGLQLHTISLDSETTVSCWLSQPPKEQLKLPPLLLIHGFGPRSTWQWRCQVGPLSRQFSLIIPDLVFFGGSTSSSPLRSETFQADVIAKLLDFIGLEDRPVPVIGTSYGGFVAYHLARALGPTRMDKVVIASSDLLKGKADDQALLKRGEAQSVAELLLPKEPKTMKKVLGLAMYKAPPFMPDFMLRDMIEKLYSDNLEEKMELIEGSIIGKKGFDITPLSHQDVLIIWGEHDQIFPMEKAFEVKRCLGEVRLEMMKETGHIPQSEDPKRFNKILIEFLLNAA